MGCFSSLLSSPRNLIWRSDEERTVRPATVSSLKMFPITTAFTSLTSPYWILSKVLPNPILRLSVFPCTRCAPSWSRCSSYLTGFSAWCSARPSPAYPVSDRESDDPGELMRENLNCAVTRRPHPALDLLLQMEIIVKFYNSVLSVGVNNGTARQLMPRGGCQLQPVFSSHSSRLGRAGRLQEKKKFNLFLRFTWFTFSLLNKVSDYPGSVWLEDDPCQYVIIITLLTVWL